MGKTTKQDTSEAAQREPMKEPEGGWPPDEYTGMAGTFIRDPYTGKRTPEVEPPSAQEQPTAD